ncbi:hypothetical protein ACQ4PT_068632 [Festuca glaucescens]
MQNLAGRIGKFIKIDTEGSAGGNFVRVRVELDVNKPLERFISMIRKGEREVYLVKYEKVPKFCEVCGLLGHEFLECGKGFHKEEDHKFGDWMIADMGRRGRGRRRFGGFAPHGGRGARAGRAFGRGRGSHAAEAEYGVPGVGVGKDDPNKMARKHLDLGDGNTEEHENTGAIVVHNSVAGKEDVNMADKDDACPAECEICGSGQNQDCMVKCIQCNGYQHRYCLMVAPLEMRGGWCCSECQEKANENPKPFQGGSKTPMLDNNCWSMAHQIGVKTPQIHENSKVKFIPCEEAVLLTKERPAARRRTKFVVRRTHSQIRPVSPPNMKCVSPSRQVRPASPPNVKPLSSMNSILPSRQVGPSSPRSMKQKCVSPSRSDNQVLSLRPCVVASQNLIKSDDINRRQKVRSGATIPMVPQNTKIAVKENVHLVRPKVENGDKGKGKSRVECQPREENTFNASVANIGCQSGPKSLHHNIDMPVIISSSVEYARRPPPEAICWRGCIVLSNGENRNLGEFKAYHPARVSPRVCNIAKSMSNNLQLKVLPRMKYWPKTFEQICPVYDDVALIFFSAELDCWKRHHLFEAYCGFVMKAYIDDMMLLIYSSEVLPPDAQWIDGENYLWGVFVKPKPKSNPVT